MFLSRPREVLNRLKSKLVLLQAVVWHSSCREILLTYLSNVIFLHSLNKYFLKHLLSFSVVTFCCELNQNGLILLQEFNSCDNSKTSRSNSSVSIPPKLMAPEDDWFSWQPTSQFLDSTLFMFRKIALVHGTINKTLYCWFEIYNSNYKFNKIH